MQKILCNAISLFVNIAKGDQESKLYTHKIMEFFNVYTHLGRNGSPCPNSFGYFFNCRFTTTSMYFYLNIGQLHHNKYFKIPSREGVKNPRYLLGLDPKSVIPPPPFVLCRIPKVTFCWKRPKKQAFKDTFRKFRTLPPPPYLGHSPKKSWPLPLIRDMVKLVQITCRGSDLRRVLES